MLLKKFIALGWHTVPLGGELRRLPDGKKSIPQFPKNWKSLYSSAKNTETSPLAGTITGKISDLIAIDCDNEATYQMFKAMNPGYKFEFKSKNKPEGGGTILYKYVPDLPNFQIRNETIALDFFSDSGFVYLPSENNFTKESWEDKEMPELEVAPQSIITLLTTLNSSTKGTERKNKVSSKALYGHRLAPMLSNFIKTKKYVPSLFRILTPKSFRGLPGYAKKGHLHPNDVPDGSGSEYLVKVSGILGADISVSVEMYMTAMALINGLFSKPMEEDRLQKTILEPMINEQSAVDGVPIWQYDKHWESMGFIFTSQKGDSIESFFDDVKGAYYLINYNVPYIKSYNNKSSLIEVIQSLVGIEIKPKIYDSRKQIVRTCLAPSEAFGHIHEKDEYNLFRPTEYLQTLNDPETYKAVYKEPRITKKFIESFVPDPVMREFLLRFIRTKLSGFSYSPLILYFIGVPGSGKDTFVSLLNRIIGVDYTAKPDTKVFLENFNGWLMDKYIVHLDEYGNKLYKSADKQEVLGRLKSYTGAERVQIRAMRQEAFNYTNSATFIITANSNPLPIEYNDRRVVYFQTPLRLDQQVWVTEEGGISVVIEKLNEELKDFCYHLAVDYERLHPNDYVIAPYNEEKENLIVETMDAHSKVAFYVSKHNIDKLVELFKDNFITGYTLGWEENRLFFVKLAELCKAMSTMPFKETMLDAALKAHGIKKHYTVMSGFPDRNQAYYIIDGLRDKMAELGKQKAKPDAKNSVFNRE